MDADELRRERLERIETVIKGKEPDRVPVLVSTSVFHAHYAGYTSKDIIHNPELNVKAAVKTAKDFDFDSFAPLVGLEGSFLSIPFTCSSPSFGPSTRFMQASFHKVLKDDFTKWPGMELSDDASPQFIGKEVMKLNEYGDYIEDPVGFLHRTALPRMCQALKNPGSPEYNGAMAEFGAEVQKNSEASAKLFQALGECGYPLIPSANSYAPLDFISDFLRDIKNIVLDFYRNGDVVKKAVDVTTPLMIESAKVSGNIPPEAKKAFGTDIVECFFPLHLNEYLNPKLYKEFYWPSLLKVFKTVIDMGQTPYVIFEGRHDAHLETLLDIPKKKLIGFFDKTDPRKVREAVGDHVILMTGPPNSLLIGGTPQKVDDYIKSMLEDCKEGGMIITPGVDGGISGDAKPENVKALVEAVHKYGKY
ncbi:uroporphyrinogen-III decarboxylase [Methanomicrobium sp. W14]|uniref:uroporphyrinogen decarboxylase family protein n=1 Tax=Methanomicrobium sp. W14 TaxID=2817839 RepID=UPI001AE7773C|nr:uroporphyrinogen decarboxylase family protein [Methanomicrobium sp. W14]MBP2134227.1 uroporphyrinogen-III decarboxylase [Methanomicrobium sp. W14]